MEGLLSTGPTLSSFIGWSSIIILKENQLMELHQHIIENYTKQSLMELHQTNTINRRKSESIIYNGVFRAASGFAQVCFWFGHRAYTCSAELILFVIL